MKSTIAFNCRIIYCTCTLYLWQCLFYIRYGFLRIFIFSSTWLKNFECKWWVSCTKYYCKYSITYRLPIRIILSKIILVTHWSYRRTFQTRVQWNVEYRENIWKIHVAKGSQDIASAINAAIAEWVDRTTYMYIYKLLQYR